MVSNVYLGEGRLLLFARAPLAGQVKRRLIPALGKEGAAALYRQLLEHQIKGAKKAAVAPVELWCTPDDSDPFLRDIANRYQIPTRCQQGNDLGERMYHAFVTTLAAHPFALLIGSDIPALTMADIRAATQALEQGNDAVLVPTEDGGYALIGLRQVVPQIFTAITWGKEQVFAETMCRLTALRWSTHLLETRWDVDYPSDLQRLHGLGIS